MKISYYGNHGHEIITSRGLQKMAERLPDFEIQEIQELKENSENQNTKKSTTTLRNVWTRRAENNFETTLVACEAKHLDENRQIGLRY